MCCDPVRLSGRFFLALGLGTGWLLFLGCGSQDSLPKLVPVTGKVLLDGQPFTKGGSVALYPDTSKGNKSGHIPGGSIGSDGTFELSTNSRLGAPLGSWKAVVLHEVHVPDPPDSPHWPNYPPDFPLPKSPVPERYKTAAKTPLTIEVVENPPEGAYTLNLTTK